MVKTKQELDYERSVKAWLKVNEIDIQTIDYEAEFDNALTSQENFEAFMETRQHRQYTTKS